MPFQKPKTLSKHPRCLLAVPQKWSIFENTASVFVSLLTYTRQGQPHPYESFEGCDGCAGVRGNHDRHCGTHPSPTHHCRTAMFRPVGAWVCCLSTKTGPLLSEWKRNFVYVNSCSDSFLVVILNDSTLLEPMNS